MLLEGLVFVSAHNRCAGATHVNVFARGPRPSAGYPLGAGHKTQRGTGPYACAQQRSFSAENENARELFGVEDRGDPRALVSFLCRGQLQ